MQMKTFFVAAVAALATAEVFAGPEEFREDPAKYWCFQELEAAPRFRDCPYPHSDYPGMRPILVEGFGPNRTAAEFFYKNGMTYVSCSPFRVPVARLAAAQAAIKEARERK